MPKSLKLTAIALVWVAVLTGCNNPDEFAQFEANDAGALPECLADQFPFEPTFLSARTRDNRTGIFLQTSSDVKHQNDVAYIQLRNTDTVPAGESIPLDEDLDAPLSEIDRRARAKLAFFSSCPDSTETLRLVGTIEFDTFEPEADGVVEGSFAGQAVDARTGDVVVDELTGSWRLVVRAGQPYQDFYGPADKF